MFELCISAYMHIYYVHHTTKRGDMKQKHDFTDMALLSHIIAL